MAMSMSGKEASSIFGERKGSIEIKTKISQIAHQFPGERRAAVYNIATAIKKSREGVQSAESIYQHAKMHGQNLDAAIEGAQGDVEVLDAGLRMAILAVLLS